MKVRKPSFECVCLFSFNKHVLQECMCALLRVRYLYRDRILLESETILSFSDLFCISV